MKILLAFCFSFFPYVVQAVELNIGLVSIKGAVEQPKTFAGIVVEPKRSLDRSIRLALQESDIKFKNFDVEPEFYQIELETDRPIEDQFDKVDRTHLLIFDLPKSVMIEAAKIADQNGALAINASLTDEDLRDEICLPGFYHSLPSDRMYFDALSQFLVHSGWRKVLLVHGTNNDDLRRTALLAEAIERFGATISDERAFTLSHHPDDRDHNQPEFLTGGSSYDVVAVIDSKRDYGRRIEYKTRRARPVVGDVGLIPRAWHYALERYGAPQLNERYRAIEPVITDPQTAMTDAEFAAWASVKFVTNSIKQQHISGEQLNLRAVFKDPESRVDLYKGTRGSFRDWNHQLRHPILLTSTNYVVDIAPMPKFLHPKHYVDTLGADRPESSCQLSE